MSTITARAIPWETETDYWGVAVTTGDGKHHSWGVGSKKLAEMEAKGIEEGGYPLYGPFMGRKDWRDL